MSNSDFTPGPNKRITTDLFDFHKHINGENFRHESSSINTSPGINGATNLQSSINNIQDFINDMADIGTAFMAIPDGYNCYTNPAPNFYFDDSIPPLSDFLIDLFDAIYNQTTLPASYERLANGGVLFIPAGTYYITETVSVPPGITILGEGYATKIINATSLDLSASPPIVDGGGTPAPLFLVKIDNNRADNDAAIDGNSNFMFGRATKFVGLTIGDNFIEPTLLGDLYYTLPQNISGETQLINQEQGSRLELENVSMIGRVSATGTIVSDATRFAVKLDESAPSATGTYLKISNCFIDGFSQPVSFLSTGGVMDHLEICNSKIRSHGYLDADDTSEESNCIIAMNDNNAVICNNDLYGNHENCNVIVYVADALIGPIDANNISKIIICSNIFIIDRGSAATVNPRPLFVDAGVASTFNSNATTMVYGNTANNLGFNVSISADGSSQFQITNSSVNIASLGTAAISSTTLTMTAGPILGPRELITTATYEADVDGANTTDHILLVPNGDLFGSVGQTEITLPPVVQGRILIIKETQYQTASNTIVASGSDLIEDFINGGYSASVDFAVAGLCITYIGVMDGVQGKWSILNFYVSAFDMGLSL